MSTTIEMRAGGESATMDFDTFVAGVDEIAGPAGGDSRERTLVTGGNPDARFAVPAAKKFEHAGSDFLPDDRLDTIAAALQSRHNLPTECAIVYRWKATGGEVNGAATPGKCVKLSGHAKHFAGADYLIWLAADHVAAFTNWEVEALLFHQLLHVAVDDESLKPKIRGHDAELFAEEFRFYGAWTMDLRRVVSAVKQMPLFGVGR